MSNIGNKIYGWYRSNPSSGVPNILYTTSTNVYVDMPLYDNNGDDTYLRITSINQDGSFNVGSYSNVYCYVDSESNQYYVFSATTGSSVYDESGSLVGTITSVGENTIIFE